MYEGVRLDIKSNHGHAAFTCLYRCVCGLWIDRSRDGGDSGRSDLLLLTKQIKTGSKFLVNRSVTRTPPLRLLTPSPSSLCTYGLL